MVAGNKMDKSQAKNLLTSLKRVKPRQLDSLMHDAHEKAFSCIDCLECANCCTTTGPLLTDTDIKRVSKHLRMKDAEFVEQYVRVDEDGDQVFKSMPCPFLGADNYCSIYEHRPKACREYPHTDRVKQHQLLKLHLKNAEICPAVDQVLEDVKTRLES
ncbi:MAG: YkgJ family cysteine cluster protein [Flavobacteriales bacterium]|nr:YkgJ family cysteine cluster protein [Flavobacteriales bacterium]MCB9204492.1 YkgJ family cysteine cluster protein [Flavobacteriales bacterium]